MPNWCVKLAAGLAWLARAASRRYNKGMVTQQWPAPASAKTPGRRLSTVR